MSMLNQGAANLSDEEQFQTNKSDDTIILSSLIHIHTDICIIIPGRYIYICNTTSLKNNTITHHTYY